MSRLKLSRRQLLKLGGLALGVPALAGGTGYGLWSNMLALEHHKLSIWGLRRPVRLGVLTDFHVPNFRFPLEELIEALSIAHCDLLLIVGDTVDRLGNERFVPGLFRDMDARMGKFAVLGNWEYDSGVSFNRLERLYERADVRLLVNERIDLELPGGGELHIVGLDDYLFGMPDHTLLDGLKGPTIVLSHCPEPADAIARRAGRPLLVISGHTHGGQIAPFGLVLYLPPGSGRFVTGWYELSNGSRLYVSPGVGNSGVPIRIGVRPTLTILEVS